jgi:hypothetical protein
MRVAKQIVFRYNGDPDMEEIDLDMDGDKTVPKQGFSVERTGGLWKVTQVNVTYQRAPTQTSISDCFPSAIGL